MTATSIVEDCVGRLIDGRFPLLQWLGSAQESSVFLTEFGDQQQKAAIKLIAADLEGAETQVAIWEAAKELSHPNLMQVFACGLCELDSKPLLYVVSEYADEVLAGIIPGRALTPEETREMLGPALSALSYLHGKGFVHSRLRPSNILAVGDQLKLSADSLVPEGTTGNRSERRTVYDAPETTQGAMGPAADVWSLGATLVEVLTQRLPAWDNNPAQIPVIPDSIPQPFAAIACECLRIDPARRCTIEQINSQLQPQSTHAVTQGAQEEKADGKTIARRRMGVALGAGAVLLATIAIWMAFEFHHEPSSPTTDEQSAASAPSSPASVPSPAPPAAPAPTPPTPAPSQEAPASPNPPPAAAAPAASAPSSSVASPEAPTPGSPQPLSSPAPTQSSQSSGGPMVKGDVSQQVHPDVLPSAMKTISGTVKVAVKVSVDSGGNVTNADFDFAGPSKYFANKALEAARRWTFKPAQAGGQAVASTWVLRFDFRREGVTITPAETTP